MNYQNMAVSELAHEIMKDWKNVNKGALPYLHAMSSLRHIRDSYGCDDGKSIVLYFLSNASTWKGQNAQAIKSELSRRCRSK